MLWVLPALAILLVAAAGECLGLRGAIGMAAGVMAVGSFVIGRVVLKGKLLRTSVAAVLIAAVVAVLLFAQTRLG